MDVLRIIENLLRYICQEAQRLLEVELRKFAEPLEVWVNDLLSRQLPPDWREQVHAYLDSWDSEFGVAPEHRPILENWIESWAQARGLMPSASAPVSGLMFRKDSRAQVAPPRVTESVDDRRMLNTVLRPRPPDNRAPHRPTQQEINERFFHQRLAAARGHLEEIRVWLEALGQRLDAAKIDEHVDVEADATGIGDLIWLYNDALESARDAWLRGGHSGEANTRLLEMLGPGSFGLPWFVDEQQAERARNQTAEIGRRLHQSNVTMNWVVAGAETVETAATVAGIFVGAGVVATVAKQGGKWAVVKTIAVAGAAMTAEQLAERGAQAAGASEQTIRGFRLAAAVVSFILLRRRAAATSASIDPRPMDTKPLTGPGKNQSGDLARSAYVAPAQSAGSALPKWRSLSPGEAKRRVGLAFNKARARAFPYNEVPIAKPGGGKPWFLDSYDPIKREIVFRRHTQFSEIQFTTAKAYLREFVKKYSPGSTIARVPSAEGLAGSRLVGRMIFEVPPQWKPIPKPVLQEAARLEIEIRDSNGRVYHAD